MGLRNRDFCREKHIESSKSINHAAFGGYSTNSTSNRHKRKPRNSGGAMGYLFYPALAVGVLWHGAEALPQYRANEGVKSLNTAESVFTLVSTLPANSHAIEPDPTNGGIVLKTDRHGHFRGTVLINDVPMPFLIDTGATRTVIPEKMAASAKLPYGSYIETNTAGGKISERGTTIKSLRLGNAVIQNLDADINRHMGEVLIGMNTLKYFNMTQDGNTLTLVANNQYDQKVINESATNDVTLASNRSIKKSTIINKTVSCDARQVCTTKYSDH